VIINQLGQNVFCVGKWVSSQLLPLEQYKYNVSLLFGICCTRVVVAGR
jgi:hypothetical protein